MSLLSLHNSLTRRVLLGVGLFIAISVFAAVAVLGFSYSAPARLYGIYSNSTSSNANPGGGAALGVFNLRSNTQPNLLPGYYAGRFKGAIEGNIVYFYCIQIQKPINFPDNYAPSGQVSEKLGWLLSHYYPNGSTSGRLASAAEESAAVQLAIWHFTDGLDLTQVYVTNSGFNGAQSVRIRNRAIVMRNATNVSGPDHHIVHSMAFATTGSTTKELGDPVQFRVQARDQSGTPMAGVVINLTTTTGTLSHTSATTGADGYTPTVTLTGSNVGNATVTARTTRTNKVRGITYHRTINASSEQAVVLASPNTDTISQTRAYTFTKATPNISTQASAAVTVGNTIRDTAVLSGGYNPTGSIVFRLYGPDNATCTGTAIYTSTITVSGNKSYVSGNYTPTQPGTYRWIASYGGDAKNTSVTHACNAANESVVVSKRTPTITTQASPNVTLGNPIYDTATLAGGYNPTGTITFRLYGPDDATCSTPIVLYNGGTGQSNVTVNGNANYQSASYTPLLPGTYRWIASYGGDTRNNAAAHACNAANESVVVSLTAPNLTTNASPEVPVGNEIFDTATLSGGLTPTGTITFDLYGPGDETCETSIANSTVTVDGNGDYESDTYTANMAGEYRWIASYSGDLLNQPESGTCNDANENVTVTPFAPTLTTNASEGIILGLGGSIYDTGTLTGTFSGTGTGTITFDLYGPGDETCETSIFTSVVDVEGDGDYNSEPYIPTEGGTYRWIADYSGDANNSPVNNECNAENESVDVYAPGPGEGLILTTNASEDVVLGGSVTDTATLSGEPLLPPVGTITFNLYGPGDETCETSIFNDEVLTTELGDYTSGSYVPAAIGTYYWIASYTPLGSLEPALVGACGEPSETVTVSEVPPLVLTLTTNASDDVMLGGDVFDTATLSAPEGTVEVVGTIGFDLYGPNDETCETSIFHDDIEIVETGVYQSQSFTPLAVGTYYWIETFTPEGAEEPTLVGRCQEPSETVIVTAVPPSPPPPTPPVPAPTVRPTPPPFIPDTATAGEGNAVGTELVPLLTLGLLAALASLSVGYRMVSRKREDGSEHTSGQ